MAKNDKRTITCEQALEWNADPASPLLEEQGITAEQYARDKVLCLEQCRKIIKRGRNAHKLAAAKEMREQYNQVILVRGWKAPERHEMAGQGGRPIPFDFNLILDALTLNDLKDLKRILDKASAATGSD